VPQELEGKLDQQEPQEHLDYKAQWVLLGSKDHKETWAQLDPQEFVDQLVPREILATLVPVVFLH
jgi:hypothetical protein